MSKSQVQASLVRGPDVKSNSFYYISRWYLYSKCSLRTKSQLGETERESGHKKLALYLMANMSDSNMLQNLLHVMELNDEPRQLTNLHRNFNWKVIWNSDELKPQNLKAT